MAALQRYLEVSEEEKVDAIAQLSLIRPPAAVLFAGRVGFFEAAQGLEGRHLSGLLLTMPSLDTVDRVCRFGVE
jgi:hypothetical protein